MPTQRPAPRRSVMRLRAVLALVTGLALVALSSGPSGAVTRITAPRVSTVAFVDVRVVPMDTERVLEHQTVVSVGGRIASIAAVGAVKVPSGATVVRGNGTATLVPGLIDLHVHTRADWNTASVWPVSPLRLLLANGVTTARDLGPIGSTHTYALAWRTRIAGGSLVGPTLLLTGDRLGEDISTGGTAITPAAAVRAVGTRGFDALKLYAYLSASDFDVAMSLAEAANVYTVGHLPFAVDLAAAVREGFDELAHAEELEWVALALDRSVARTPAQWLDAVADRLLERYSPMVGMDRAEIEAAYGSTVRAVIAQLPQGFAVDSTLGATSVLVQSQCDPAGEAGRPELAYEPSGPCNTSGAWPWFRSGLADLIPVKWEIEQLVARELHRAGMLVVVGTDAGTGDLGVVPGFSVHDELALLVANGFTRFEALAAATRDAGTVLARMAGRADPDRPAGVVVVGARADLVLVSSNPLVSLDALRRPLGVLAAGRWYPASMLTAMTTLPAG